MFSLYHLQSIKRPKSLGNVTEQAIADLSPADDQWSEILFPLSGGWSPPVFIPAKDPREEERKQYEKDCRLVKRSRFFLHSLEDLLKKCGTAS